MPRNAAGVYSLPNPPVVTDTTILSLDENTTRDDVATELTNSLDRNGRGGMLAPFRIFDGLVATPGLAFLNEINSGLYRAGANDIRMSVAAADVLKFTPNTITVPAGVTLNLGGPFTISGVFTANNTFIRNGAAGTSRDIQGRTSGSPRWVMELGDAVAESGSNAGSDFTLLNYNDAGVNISTPLRINRATGTATFNGPVIAAAGSISTGSATALSLATGGGVQFQVTNVFNAINFVRVFGQSIGNHPGLVSDGADPNVNLRLISKGTGFVGIETNGGVEQVRVLHSAGPNYLTLTGGTRPTIEISGGPGLAVTQNLVRNISNDGLFLWADPVPANSLARIEIYGATHGTSPKWLMLRGNPVRVTGDDSSAVVADFDPTGGVASRFIFKNGVNPTIQTSGGNLTLNTLAVAVTNGSITLNVGNGDNKIGTATADGADNARLFISGGGAYGDSARGSYIIVSGNESVNAGACQYAAGNIGAAGHHFYTRNSVEQVRILDSAGPNYLRLTGGANPTISASGGNVTIAGSLIIPSAAFFFLDGGFDTGIAESPANVILFQTAGVARGTFGATGAFRVNNLAGSGTRTVQAQADGTLIAP